MDGKMKSRICNAIQGNGVEEYINASTFKTESNIVAISVIGGDDDLIYDMEDCFDTHTITDIKRKTFFELIEDVNRKWCDYILNDYKGNGLCIQLPEVKRLLILDPADVIKSYKEQDYCVCAIAVKLLSQVIGKDKSEYMHEEYLEALLKDHGYTQSDFDIDQSKVTICVPIELNEEEKAKMLLEIEKLINTNI